ncbi:MAG: heavy-metal-associated domain-containing protein [Aggregatilineales bacterium]
MQQKTFKVPNIGCDGCVRAIENELGDMAGVQQVTAAVDTQMVTISYDVPETWQQIVATLVEIDYAPAEA